MSRRTPAQKARTAEAPQPVPVPYIDLDALLSTISDVVAVVDRDGRYVWIATTLLTQSGLGKDRAEWITGKRIHDLAPEPEADRLLACLHRALDTGETQRVEYQGDVWGRKVWFAATIRRLSQDAAIWVARDITSSQETNQDLARWRERHLALVNSVDAILWESDADFRFTFVSEQAERLLGYPVEQWLNEPDFWAEHTHPDDREWCVSFCLDKTAAGEAHDFEYRMVTADGRTVWLRDIVTVITKDGKPVALRGVMIDITALKEAFDLVSSQEAQYRAIFEASSDGLVINDPETGLILEANPAFCRMHGYEDMTGMHPTDHIHPNSHHLFDDYIETTRSGGQFRTRAQDVRQDGSVFDVEVIGRGFTYQGRTAILGVVRDVTEQVQSEDRLEEKVKERTRELTAMLEVSRNMSSTLALKPLLRLVLQQMQLVAAYHRAAIFIPRGDSLEMLDSITAGAPEDEVSPEFRFPMSQVEPLWGPISSGVAVIIPDLHADDPAATAYRQASGDLIETTFKDSRSWLGVPLVSNDQVIGAVTVTHKQPDYYNVQHTRLVQAIANQAATAIENARLYEREEERSRELTTLLDVSMAMASTLEMDELLEIVMNHLQTLVHCLGVSIAVIEDGDLVVVASRVAPGRKTQDAALGVPIPLSSATWSRLSEGKELIIDDILSDSAEAALYREAVGQLLTDDSRPYIRSWMGVPMKHKDAVVGMISVSTDKPAFYTHDHARLVQAVAASAAAAVQNAHLYEHAGERSRELATLLEVSRDVASTLDLDALLGLILEQAARLVPYHRATFSLIDSSIMWIRSTPDSGLWPESGSAAVPVKELPFGAAGSHLRNTVLSEGKPIIIEDIEGDSDLAAAFRSGESTGPIPPEQRIRSWMGVPVAVKDRVLGVLTMSSKEAGFFTKRHAELAMALTSQVAVAVENAQLYEQAQQLAAVEERQRLARELHDSVSQALYGIALGARTARTLLDRDPPTAVEPVDYVLSLAEASLAEMRALIFELRPESLENEGLVVALNKQIEAARTRFDIDVEWAPPEEPDAQLRVKEAVYRIIQEALHNVIKHARAEKVRVRLESADGRLHFEVTDDGVGFDLDGNFAGHLGLQSMRERAERLRGHIHIESEPSQGSRVSGHIPL